MLIDRSNLSQHLAWIVATLAVAVLATIGYFASALGAAAWPAGSSLTGLVFGVIGGAICLFEFLLWPRKQLRAWRLGRTQVWMRAHIWLGLLAVPLLVFHSGFRWGGLLSTVLMALFLVVIASGIWGLIVQQFLPMRMLDDVPAETIYSQIPAISHMMAKEAERLVLATCGTEAGEGLPATDAELAVVGVTHMVVGAVRQTGRVQGKVLETYAPTQAVPNAEFLAASFRDMIEPYLEGGASSGSALRHAPRSEEIFEEIRTRINPAAHPVVAQLEQMCEQRRQLDLQQRLHFWLHNWLCIHLPLSAALILLMLVHVFVTLKYW